MSAATTEDAPTPAWPTGGERVGVFVKTLGCKVNQVESERIAVELLGAGVRMLEEDAAEVVVVNTCTVTGEADTKARKAVRQALRAAESPVVVVTGCLAALDADGLKALGDRVIVEPSRDRVASRVIELLGARPGTTVPTRVGREFRTRVAVKIEDGCDAFCSYCIVPHARGVPRSVPLRDIIAEVEAVVSAGTREVVLTGINLGRYDNEGHTLADVVRAVASTGIERVRLSSVEPTDLETRLLEELASEDAFCPHLHVPLQAGDDEVLRAMNRRYTTAEYARRLAHVREVLGPLAITTDVIAGFPGETDAQAERTARFCEEMEFARLHVFRYSRRQGTPAAEIAAQVEAPLRAERAARVRDVDARLRRRYAESRLGDEASVLVERVVPLEVADGVPVRAAGADARPLGVRIEGTSEDYLRVRVDAPALGRSVQVGAVVPVWLTGFSEGYVSGVITVAEGTVG